MRTLIKNGHIVCPVQKIDAVKNLIINDTKIEEISDKQYNESEFDKVIDATGLFVVPGFIDMHVHLREPGHEGAETIATGTKSAASGGFTAVACMPNTEPAIDNAYVTQYINTKAKEEGLVKVYVIGAITAGRKGEQLAEIGEMYKAGIVAVSDDGDCVMDSYVMRKAMDYCKQFNLLVIDHCEDTNLKGQGVMNDGYYSMKLGLRGIPKASEDIMVARDIALCKHTGARTHIAHLSTAGSVKFIRDAKKDGTLISCEVTPHHIALTENAIKDYDTNAKVMPPLRTDEDREEIIRGIQDGTIDAIATDHAPHSIEKKDIEFQQAKSGMIGLETALPICLNLVNNKTISITKLIELMSTNPANLLNIEGGSLQAGKSADIAVFNKDESWVYTHDKIISKSKNSPFIGSTLIGKVKYTICNGKIVWESN